MRLILTDVFRKALRAEIERQVRERALHAEITGGEKVPAFLAESLVKEIAARGR